MAEDEIAEKLVNAVEGSRYSEVPET